MSLIASLLEKALDTSLTWFLVFIVIVLINHLRKLRNLPPGPWGYPIVGIFPKIKNHIHLTFFEYSRTYGKICSFKMGMANHVVISDLDLMKKAMRSKLFVSRPHGPLNSILGGYGVINSEGALWKNERRFLINQKLGLRSHGFLLNNNNNGPLMTSSKQMENCIQREVTLMLQIIARDYLMEPLNPSILLNAAISNVICSFVMSHRFQFDDPQFVRFMFLFDEGFRLFCQTGKAMFIPFLTKLAGVKHIVTELKNNREEMLQFVKKIIQKHKQNLDYSNPKDLIDSYLIKMSQSQNEENYFENFDQEQQLEQIVLDLFSAGVETLKTSLLWAIVFMLHYPHVMAKVQDEMDQVVGKKRLPSLDDMPKLPYTKATMYEVMRRSSVVALGTPHSNDRDVEFEGYTIPKNSTVVPLIYAVHMSPEHWSNPEEFNPERFLNSDHTKVIKPAAFIPFGVGQRMCIGDQMAEKEFFLLFTSLLHSFDIEAPNNGKPLPNLTGSCAVTITPDQFEIVCQPRNFEALSNALQSDEIEDLKNNNGA